MKLGALSVPNLAKFSHWLEMSTMLPQIQLSRLLLCALSAAGDVIPPMHIFSGQRFWYNPLEGGVSGAYFGKSEKGWITTELFYGWLANHFILRIPPIRPVALLVNGHSTHIDIEISKLCKEKGIPLYCLPAHSSHITQPLDVGFYGPLKQAWKKAVANYAVDHIGKSVTKQTFARIFKEAWENTVKVSTIVNLFLVAGIYPVDFTAIHREKVIPSTLYRVEEVASTGSMSKPNDAALEALEKAMGSETKEKFAVRCEEGYDLETDELYVVWSKLKALSIKDSEKSDEESVEPLQKDSMAKGRVKASDEKEKLEQRNIDKEQTSQKKVKKQRTPKKV